MQKKYLYLLAGAHLANDINTGSLPAVLPFFVSLYGMDYTDVAGLMFASSFLSSIIQPLFGYLADRGARQWFIPLGIFLAGAPLAATGFTSNYWAIFAAVTMMGIGSAIFHPEAARTVNAISGNERGASMSIFSVGGNGGFGLGPLLAVFLITTFGMRGMALYGIISLAMSLLLLSLLEPLRRCAKSMNDDGNTPKEKSMAKTENLKNDWHAFSRLTLVIFFRSTVQSAVSAFLPLYCIDALGASNAAGSVTLSVISIAGIVATLLGGRISDRIGYVRTLRLGCALLVPVLALMVFPRNMYLVYAMLIPFSIGMQGAYSSFVVLGQSYLAKSVGFASGVTLGISFSIGGVMTPSLGIFADNFGIYAVMAMIVLISFAAALATMILPEPKNRGQ